MEVIELVSVIGIHSCAVGVPILIEELRRVTVGARRASAEHGRAHRPPARGRRRGRASASTSTPRALAGAGARAGRVARRRSRGDADVVLLSLPDSRAIEAVVDELEAPTCAPGRSSST